MKAKKLEKTEDRNKTVVVINKICVVIISLIVIVDGTPTTEIGVPVALAALTTSPTSVLSQLQPQLRILFGYIARSTLIFRIIIP